MIADRPYVPNELLSRQRGWTSSRPALPGDKDLDLAAITRQVRLEGLGIPANVRESIVFRWHRK